METSQVVLDSGTGQAYDQALHRPDVLPDGGDLCIITKDSCTEAGRAGVMLTFTVEISPDVFKRAQTCITMRNALSALHILQAAYDEEGRRRPVSR